METSNTPFQSWISEVSQIMNEPLAELLLEKQDDPADAHWAGLTPQQYADAIRRERIWEGKDKEVI